MQRSQVPKSGLYIFRSLLYICAVYFLLMGLLMMISPELVTQNLGVQHPRIVGMLRGIGGSILGSTIFYILVASKPFERRWAALIIAFANVLAILLDIVSVHLGEFTLDNALIDIPIETLSCFTIIVFYTVHRNHTEEAQ
jgi:Na+/H+ antiporter NhaA